MKTARQALPTIRALAKEHSLDQAASSCTCGHIGLVHADRGTGRCHGRPRCRCLAFRGIFTSRQRLLERFGVALVARLKAEEKK